SNQTVFTVIVGGRPFRLSWESLKSDGPNNFFVNFFLKRREARVMYIDRDADIFQLIVHHLRGYYEHLYVNVGGRDFRISWTLLRKALTSFWQGGRNTFFTGPLQHSLFDPHDTPFQGAPLFIDRDPDIFQEIINHLRGYTVHIKDETHRRNLLKDAQYYMFRQLTDKLQTASKTVDGFGESTSPEVLLLLRDVRMSNLLPVEDMAGPLLYKREDLPHTLLVQV
ncbi:hypothetical protein DM01DRAFT_242248, partial [Hesseltinella vesiculosa]